MADAHIAISLTLQHEGGYVDNPEDPGGATNMGVEQRDLPNVPIKTLTTAQATAYYLEHYWKPLYSEISNQAVASKLFDLGVLFGIGTAVKNLQSALGITPDGVFGPASLLAVNCASLNPSSLLALFKIKMCGEAMQIVNRKPSSYQFMSGWLRRINS